MNKERNDDEEEINGITVECPSCGSKEIFRDDEEKHTCRTCGFVIEEKVPMPKKEISENDDGKIESRRGPPGTYQKPGGGKKTSIDNKGYGKSAKEKQKMYDLKNTERWTWYNQKERSLSNLLNEISRICGVLGTGRAVKEAASKLCREVVDESLTKGRPVEATASAVIIIAGMTKVDRIIPVEKVAKIAGVSVKEINRAEGFLTKNLDLHTVYPTYDEMLPSMTKQMMQLYDISRERYWNIYNIAKVLTKKMEEERMTTGKNQRCIAISGVVVAMRKLGYKVAITEEVLELAGTSRATVYKRIKEIEKVEQNEEVEEKISEYMELPDEE